MHTKIEKIFHTDDRHKKALKKLGLDTVRDLLYYFPSRYANISEIKKISELAENDTATIYGKVLSTKTTKAYRKKIPIGEATISDGNNKIKVVWFHQAYAAKMIKKGDFVKLSGKITKNKKGELYFANPEFEKTKELPIDIGDSLFKGDKNENIFEYAIYPESKGITSRWIYHCIQKILKNDVLKEIEDPIPDDILKKYNLPTLKTALVWIHSPKKEAHRRSARKRFAFEEIFFIQLTRQKARNEYKQNNSFKIETKKEDIEDFLGRFPFKPTKAQTHAIEAITKDLKKDAPMTRLLEGDVGSGKTLVAAATAYATIMTRPRNQDFGNLQVAYMAPTEILANQHFESFIEYFSHLPVNIGLITGSGCKKFPSKTNPTEATKISRAQLLSWVGNGEIPILIGTHALIQKSVQFKHLAYVMIDEQHRYGINQRAELVKKNGIVPHLLSMTATPIPRTLALTIYGDLDLTLLDESPPGRKLVITNVITPDKRDEVYEKIRKELETGRQTYVICPRINPIESRPLGVVSFNGADELLSPQKRATLNMKSVKAEAKRLKENIFPEYKIEILHSKLKSKEKEEIMDEFARGETDILVSTSVIEVGVNVPNATVIIIEGAERFGLAQLHQLRGRVLRSSHQAYCYLFTSNNNSSEQTLKRLMALGQATNGFELAELDLSLRGAGELAGAKQWGISDIGMEAIKNIKMVEAAREEARNLLAEDFALAKHPLISSRLVEQKTDIHFE